MILPKKAVQEMEPYDPPLEGRRDKLRLDFSENTVGPSPRVLKALEKLNDNEFACYPEYTKFINKIASNINVSPQEILLTNASDEAIKVIYDTYIEKGDEIVIPIPTFTMFRVYADIAEAKVKSVSYAKNLTFPTKKVLDAITKKTKILILVNPNNPTGTPIEKKDLFKIVEKAAKTETIVIIDEAYYQFSEETALGLIGKFDNLFILQTFSKAYGLAGLRLGYIASDPDNIKNLKRVASPYSVNTAAMVAASTAIDDQDYLKWYVGEVKKGKKVLEEGLKQLKIKTFPTTGNFLIANFGKKAIEIKDQLKEKGILVRDRSHLPLLKDCLRVSIGTSSQAKQFIQTLREILGK
ncbi:MAG: histidinol-phosphate transaminase [Candidatus Woesearchaeota archaeon]|jgi:histidinol-phosphate aminotransferase|nr:histidinol-phosphate transaminase [Candidatus Woesearchaeota archaeon]